MGGERRLSRGVMRCGNEVSEDVRLDLRDHCIGWAFVGAISFCIVGVGQWRSNSMALRCVSRMLR